jgi:hypothetical protein
MATPNDQIGQKIKAVYDAASRAKARADGLEAELVFVRSQLDKVRAAGQLAEDHLNDEDYDRQYALEELLLSLSEICSMPLPSELAEVSPKLAEIYQEGRVS